MASLFQRLKARLALQMRRLFRPRWLYLLAKRLRPISVMAGIDRGRPIDRYFIEKFLDARQHLVRGHCLEIKDNAYTVRFGGSKVTKSDILDINRENKEATIYGDLKNLSMIADETYDCFILTQVLQYVDDLDRALSECVRILKPGGALLVTVPSLGKLDGQEDNVIGHYWRLTPDSARYLFRKHFPAENLEIQGWGNILVGLSFWIGLACEEMSRKKLDYYDPSFACGVSIQAIKPATAPTGAPAAEVPGSS
ncbi:MAG TPA: methyltransferase domain-containing protein [Gemmataceae bacterium]|nr:methyltransferase domain-containing protein [Gemmataceae bacterium]